MDFIITVYSEGSGIQAQLDNPFSGRFYIVDEFNSSNDGYYRQNDSLFIYWGNSENNVYFSGNNNDYRLYIGRHSNEPLYQAKVFSNGAFTNTVHYSSQHYGGDRSGTVVSYYDGYDLYDIIFTHNRYALNPNAGLARCSTFYVKRMFSFYINLRHAISGGQYVSKTVSYQTLDETIEGNGSTQPGITVYTPSLINPTVRLASASNSSYVFDRWLIYGNNNTLIHESSDNPFTFSGVCSVPSYSGTFNVKTAAPNLMYSPGSYTVTVLLSSSAYSSYVTISFLSGYTHLNGNSAIYANGSTCSISISLNQNVAISGYQLNGQTISYNGGNISFTVTSNVTVTLDCAFKVTTSKYPNIIGSSIYINGSDVNEYQCQQNGQFTLSATLPQNSNYFFAYFKHNLSHLHDNPKTIQMTEIANAGLYTAYFNNVYNNIPVSVYPASSGSVSYVCPPSGFPVGTMHTFQAVAAENNTFGNFTVTSLVNNNETIESYSDDILNLEITPEIVSITANFYSNANDMLCLNVSVANDEIFPTEIFSYFSLSYVDINNGGITYTFGPNEPNVYLENLQLDTEVTATFDDEVSVNNFDCSLYKFTGWEYGLGHSIGNNHVYDIIFDPNYKYLYATFTKQIRLNFKTYPENAGVIYRNAVQITQGVYDVDETITISTTPTSNWYTFNGWYESQTNDFTNATSLNINNPTLSLVAQNDINDYIIFARYSEAEHVTITIDNYSSIHGILTINGATIYSNEYSCVKNSNVQIQYEPNNTGYRFVKFIVDNDEHSQNPYTILNVSSDITLTVISSNQYTLTVCPNYSNRGTTTIRIDGTPTTANIEYGEKVYIDANATPNSNFAFDHWVSSVSNLNIQNDIDGYYINMPNYNVQLTAIFTSNAPNRTITLNTYCLYDGISENNFNTSIGICDGAGEYADLSQQYVSAIPVSYARFDSWREWQIIDNAASNVVLSTNPNYAFQVDSDKTLTAYFSYCKITIPQRPTYIDSCSINGEQMQIYGNSYYAYAYTDNNTIRIEGKTGFAVYQVHMQNNIVKGNVVDIDFSDQAFRNTNVTLTPVIYRNERGNPVNNSTILSFSYNNMKSVKMNVPYVSYSFNIVGEPLQESNQ